MFLWTTTLPIASNIATGFLFENINFLSGSLRQVLVGTLEGPSCNTKLCVFRVAVLEANYHVAQIIIAHGYDVLDMHYYLRAMMEHR